MVNVGSADVTVVPDFRGFSASAERQIGPEAAALGAKLGRIIAAGIQQQIQAGMRAGLNSGNPGAQGARQGDDFGGSFARSFKARVEAAVKSLPKIQLDANSSPAEVKLASVREQLEELRDKRIGVDISEGDALEKLGILHARLDELNANASSIQVKADTAQAKAQLDALIAEVRAIGGETARVKVDADTAEADAALAGTAAEADALGGSASGAAGGFSGLIAAGIALGPALIPVIAAVTAAVVGLISILGAGVLGVGVLALGFSGVIKGVQALDQAQTKSAGSGRSAASAALAQAGANQALVASEAGLTNARANAADAAVRSAEQVKNAKSAEVQAEQTAAQQITAAQVTLKQAQDNLTTAQQAAAAAQTALTNARATAAQQEQDLANQVTDGALAQRQAVLDVARAQDALNTTNNTAGATDQQKAQAQLDLDQVLQRQSELALAQQRLTDQKAASDKAGIEGSAGVVAAQKNVAQSTQGVIDAQKKLADAADGVKTAQSNAAAVIAKAQQGVTDALRAQASQQRQSAFSIQQALNAVASAHRGVASAALAGGGSVAATSALQSAFDHLDPATKKFVRFIHDQLEPAFKTIQGAAAKGLLPGVEEGLKILLPVLPGLAKFVGQVASALGQMFVQGAKTLKDPFWTQFFGFVSKNAIPALQGIFTFLLDVAQGFAGLVEAFAPVTATVGGGLLGLAASFAQFGASAASGKNDSFNGFLAYVQEALPVVVGFLSDLGGAISTIVQVFAPWGVLLLQIVGYVASLITALGPTGLATVLAVAGAAVLLLATPLFEVGLPLIAVIAAVTALAGGATYLYEHVKPVHDFIDQHFLPLFHELSDYFTSTVLPILQKVGGEALAGIKAGIATVAEAIQNNKPQLEELYGTFKQAADFIVTKVLPLLGPILKAAFEGLGLIIYGFISTVSGIVDAFDAIPGAATSVWNTVSDIFTSGVNGVIDVINFFIKALDHIPGVNIDVIGHLGTPHHQGAPVSSGNGSATGGGHTGFAGGGVLPGYSPGVDSVLAMLSPGEGILVPEAVRMLGPGWVYAVNKLASGRQPGGGGHFAGGGLVSGIIDDLKGAAGGLVNFAAGPAISGAESAAHAIAARTIPAGFFRSMADGYIDTIGSSLKFSGGGIVGASVGNLVGAAAAPSYSRPVTTPAGDTYHVKVDNNGLPVTGQSVVTALSQHHTLHGSWMLAGT